MFSSIPLFLQSLRGSTTEILDKHESRWNNVIWTSIDSVFDDNSENMTLSIISQNYWWTMASKIHEKDLFSTVRRIVCSRKVCYPWIFLYVLASFYRAFKGLLNDIQLSLGECVIDEIRVVRCDGCTHVRRTAELFHQKSDRKRSRLWHFCTPVDRGEK